MRSWSAVEVPDLATVGAGRNEAPIRVPDSSSGRLIALQGFGGQIRIYVCGITPYDATHLGHAATYLLFDIMSRACLDAGNTVRLVQNVTDVDDPLLERAAATGEDWVALAERETELFREDMTALRILPPAAYVGAVEAIPEIVETIQTLIATGAAYDLDGDIYFSVAADPSFGSVAHLDPATMLTLFGERGGDPERPGKKDPLDPLLWRAARPGEPSWETALGAGRPGWHIECATIAMRNLGEAIDVQGGGQDLLFPHHEMSEAHACMLRGFEDGERFAATNVHQALVGYQGEKMSKSRGNLVFVSKLRADGVDPMAIRLALLAHSSRQPWDWQDGELAVATARLDQWRHAVRRETAPPAADLIAEIRAALANGLDTPAACNAVDTWCDTTGLNPADQNGGRLAAAAIDALLGIL